MSDMKSLKLTLTSACVVNPQLVVVTALTEDLVKSDVPHTLVYFFENGAWFSQKTAEVVTSLCALDGKGKELNLLTPQGTVLRWYEEGGASERIDDSDEGPSDLVHMRHIQKIGRHVYAAGMARRVYRKSVGGEWAAMDEGCHSPRGRRSKAVGFNAIGGVSEKAIYAVGYQGEIWFYDGKTWQQDVSPVSTVLNVLAVLDKRVYAAGMGGTLVSGVFGRFETLEQDVTTGDFWGMAPFQGHLYLSNEEGVFRLEDGRLKKVLKATGKVTTRTLSCADGLMWSVGAHSIFSTVDGTSWERVEDP